MEVIPYAHLQDYQRIEDKILKQLERNQKDTLKDATVTEYYIGPYYFPWAFVLLVAFLMGWGFYFGLLPSD